MSFIDFIDLKPLGQSNTHQFEIHGLTPCTPPSVNIIVEIRFFWGGDISSTSLKRQKHPEIIRTFYSKKMSEVFGNHQEVYSLYVLHVFIVKPMKIPMPNHNCILTTSLSFLVASSGPCPWGFQVIRGSARIRFKIESYIQWTLI